MTGIEAIGNLGLDRIAGPSSFALTPPSLPAAGGSSFADMLAHGVQAMENKVSAADNLVKQFAVDDSIPLHRVTYALEEARMAVELAMQVRGRLVETYRDLMNMQL